MYNHLYLGVRKQKNMIKLSKILNGSLIGSAATKHANTLECAIKEYDGNFAKCVVRDYYIEMRPEEVIRQLFLMILIKDYGYPTSRLMVEYPINFGSEIRYADIVVLDKKFHGVPYIIAEIKNPSKKGGENQLKSYCNASGAPMAVLYNGISKTCYQRKEPNRFVKIFDIPTVHQTLDDILSLNKQRVDAKFSAFLNKFVCRSAQHIIIASNKKSTNAIRRARQITNKQMFFPDFGIKSIEIQLNKASAAIDLDYLRGKDFISLWPCNDDEDKRFMHRLSLRLARICPRVEIVNPEQKWPKKYGATDLLREHGEQAVYDCVFGGHGWHSIKRFASPIYDNMYIEKGYSTFREIISDGVSGALRAMADGIESCRKIKGRRLGNNFDMREEHDSQTGKSLGFQITMPLSLWAAQQASGIWLNESNCYHDLLRASALEVDEEDLELFVEAVNDAEHGELGKLFDYFTDNPRDDFDGFNNLHLSIEHQYRAKADDIELALNADVNGY